MPLVPHPDTPSGAARSLVVHLRREPESLALRYVLTAEMAHLRVPAPRPPARRNGLWRHTCFEIFVAAGRSSAYQEFNFSPSGEWAAYAFARYREPGEALECPPPAIEARASDGALELEVAMALALRGPLRIGLSAVVEAAEGALSYWALGHPSAQPDFHHAASFALEIDEVRH